MSRRHRQARQLSRSKILTYGPNEAERLRIWIGSTSSASLPTCRWPFSPFISVSVPMPPRSTCWAPAQSSSVSTQCHFISTTINKKLQKSSLGEILQKTGFFGSHRTKKRAHNKLSEAEQPLDLFRCMLLCITPQALVRNTS